MTIRGPTHLTKSLARAAELGLELSQLHTLLPDLLLGEAGGALELRGAQPSAFDGGFALNQRPISERELLLSRRELAISAGDRDLAPLELSEPLLEGSFSGDHCGLLLRRRLLLHAQRRLRHPEGVERASSSAVITSGHHQKSSPEIITKNHNQRRHQRRHQSGLYLRMLRASLIRDHHQERSSEIIIVPALAAHVPRGPSAPSPAAEAKHPAAVSPAPSERLPLHAAASLTGVHSNAPRAGATHFHGGRSPLHALGRRSPAAAERTLEMRAPDEGGNHGSSVVIRGHQSGLSRCEHLMKGAIRSPSVAISGTQRDAIT